MVTFYDMTIKKGTFALPPAYLRGMTDIEYVKTLLSVPKQVAIIAHRNPDGDALGSSLGLQIFLEKLGHSVKVVMPSEAPSTFSYLPRIGEMTVFDLKHDAARAVIDEAEVIFALDFNGLDRVDKLGENISFSKAKKVLIDHHLDPEPFDDYRFVDTSASSTAELVYLFIEALDELRKLDVEIGTCLFTGLITDTGSFKYATRPQTYHVAAKLKELGVDDYGLQDMIFNSLKEKHLRLLGHCLVNRMTIIPEYRTAYIYLSKQDYAEFEISRGDTEGIVNHMLMMSNVDMAAFITEQPSIVKISLRSKGDISVQEIAMKHFKGGGHKNASGGAMYSKLDHVIKRFVDVVPRYMPKVVV